VTRRTRGALSLLGAALALAVAGLVPASAGATVTIGQLGDATGSDCDAGFDALVLTPPTGNSYIAPGVGTITSWSMRAVEQAGQQLTMKMFRKVGEPATFQVVGHAGPQTLTPGSLNTFPANIRVQPGDALGLHNLTADSRCAFSAPGVTLFIAPASDLADGASGPFQADNEDFALSIQATFDPDNTFTFTKAKRNRSKGNAVLTFKLPNPGTLSASGGGAKVAKAKTVAAGKAKLKVKARGLKSRALNSDGKVKLKLQVIYTPTGGDPRTRKLTVKLLKS
jgi:hypothetical protein